MAAPSIALLIVAASLAPQEQDEGALASHERMLAELDRVEQRTPQENAYLETVLVGEYRGRLAAAPADLAAIERVQLVYTTGVLELRSGDLERAVELLQEGYDILNGLGVEAYPKLRQRLLYQLALANLRLGETQNCIARHTSQSCILPIAKGGQYAVQGAARAALGYFLEFAAGEAEGAPRQLTARWLANIAAMAVGEFPDGVPEAHRLSPKLFESEAAFPAFEDIAPRLGINVLDMAGGAAVEDFDGDGRLDVLTSTWDPALSLTLFLRSADGGFTDHTEQANLEGLRGGLNVVHADYDGDGDADVLVLRGAWLHGETGRHPNSLLRNDGDAHFLDVTFLVGLGDGHYPTQAAGWADYDNDGDLDLYVGNEASQRARYPSQLFSNQGDGTFEDVARRAGVINMRYAKGVDWGDVDADGRIDLYVSNQLDANRLYMNEADGTFEDVAAERGVQDPRQSFATWFWDYDNDGHLDLYVASYHQLGPEDNQGSGEGLRLYPAVASLLGLPHDAEPARLYRGDGRGGFTDVSANLGLGGISLAMGSNYGDLDNDGWLDFYLGTGYPYFDGVVPNQMYRNDAGRRFVDVTFAGGFGHLQKGHGVVFADLDDDGDQDIFEQMGGGFYADAYGNVLYENPGFGRHWVKLALHGEASNRSGIGARLELRIREKGRVRTLHREVSTGGSFGSNPLTQHIGLGEATRIERLEVTWPATGKKQTWKDLPTDRLLRIREGTKDPEIVRVPPLPFAD